MYLPKDGTGMNFSIISRVWGSSSNGKAFDTFQAPFVFKESTFLTNTYD